MKTKAYKQKLAELLEELASSKDTEMAHHEADLALVDFVRFLGHDDIADLYDKVGKWYA